MGRPLKATLEQALAAAEKGQGRPSVVARILGVNLDTLRSYRARWKSFDAAMVEASTMFDESLVDEAEFKLREAVLAGKAWAIRYTLSTKGKSRGYTERTEVTGKDGDAIALDLTTAAAELDGKLARLAASLSAEAVPGQPDA